MQRNIAIANSVATRISRFNASRRQRSPAVCKTECRWSRIGNIAGKLAVVATKPSSAMNRQTGAILDRLLAQNPSQLEPV